MVDRGGGGREGGGGNGGRGGGDSNRKAFRSAQQLDEDMALYSAARDGKDLAEVKAALQARRMEEAKAQLDAAMVCFALDEDGSLHCERLWCAASWLMLVFASAFGHQTRYLRVWWGVYRSGVMDVVEACGKRLLLTYASLSSQRIFSLLALSPTAVSPSLTPVDVRVCSG